MADSCLQGGCSCGRNQYEIALPPHREAKAAARILFGETADLRRAYASALPTFLRIPLPWLQSTTYAFFDDEKHSEIRRAFTPISAPHTKRIFCGFCGTSLSFWSEATREEADFIYMNLASLERTSLGILDDLGVLPKADDEDDSQKQNPSEAPEQASSEPQAQNATTNDFVQTDGSREIRGQPWFEELIETGPLGRLKRRRGGEIDNDGSMVVEWEVVEVDGQHDGGGTPSKRPLIDPGADTDVRMRGN